ncbi:MAG TPA: universal stress protein [Polyangiaceae bacterium]|nr:universal stress protein [Polyangiaceae bacterium]
MQNPKPYVIVVGVDYSNTGELALTRAFELATERQNAEVHIVHVLQTLGALMPLEFGASVGGPDPTMMGQASEQLRKYADQRLQEFKQSPFASGKTKLFERAISHLRLDAPAHELAQLASDLDADLLVVGTHGRRGATRLLVGSVAEGVVRLAPCQVLVVRNKFVDQTVPKIEPPCPRCVEARLESRGAEMWCADHRERHGRRHTYHQVDRVGAETNFPLVTPER